MRSRQYTYTIEEVSKITGVSRASLYLMRKAKLIDLEDFPSVCMWVSAKLLEKFASDTQAPCKHVASTLQAPCVQNAPSETETETERETYLCPDSQARRGRKESKK